MLSVHSLNEAGIFSKLATATVSLTFFVIWSSSSDNHVLVYSSTGEWVGIKISENAFSVWEQTDGDIYSVPFYDIASCAKCSFIVVVSKAPSHNGFWELVILKLRTGKTAVEKQKCSFFFLPDEKLTGHVLFCPRKVTVLSSTSPDTKQVDFCCSHTILVKIGSCIVICNLDLCDSGDCVVSETRVCALCSNSRAFPSAFGEKHCLSVDKNLLGYVSGDTFHVWNLETFKQTKCRLDGLELNRVECKAVGRLCSILCVRSTLYVISSVTGRILLTYAHLGGSAQQLFAPIHQDWLNTFEPSSSFELATVIRREQLPCLIVL